MFPEDVSVDVSGVNVAPLPQEVAKARGIEYGTRPDDVHCLHSGVDERCIGHYVNRIRHDNELRIRGNICNLRDDVGKQRNIIPCEIQECLP